MFSAAQSSTPVHKDTQSSKRTLSSPFSPEDHLTKKNKAEMDELASPSSFTQSESSLMNLPPPDPEILQGCHSLSISKFPDFSLTFP